MPSGFLTVWKPAGITSHDVVNRVRRLAGVRQVGHAGTLDPDAEGVLPIAVGGYTRLLEFAAVSPKVYQAELILGERTSSGDAHGRMVGHSAPPWPSVDEIHRAMRWLHGAVWQVPPQVSAIKVAGQRAYRRPDQSWLRPRRVDIHRIELLAVQSPRQWRFEAEVGSGTYIRALARDWAELLGHAGCVSHLVRSRAGSFRAEDSVSLEGLAAQGARWVECLQPYDAHLAIPVVDIVSRWKTPIQHGQLGVLSQALASAQTPGPLLITCAKQLLAVVDGPPWRYRKVWRD